MGHHSYNCVGRLVLWLRHSHNLEGVGYYAAEEGVRAVQRGAEKSGMGSGKLNKI
jgi:hypothetical protein